MEINPMDSVSDSAAQNAAEASAAHSRLNTLVAIASAGVFLASAARSDSIATNESKKKADVRVQAEGDQKAYDLLNYRDDQFDLPDAMAAIAISLLAMTALTYKRWKQSTQTASVACALFACAVAMAACVPVDVASHPREVQPERPTVATHAGTVAPAYVEVETGLEVDRYSDKSQSGLIPTVIKFGVAPRVQFSLSVPVYGATPPASAGIGDIAAAFKFTVLKDHPILSDFAIQPQLKFSTGGERGSRTNDVSLLLIDSRSIGAVDVDLNVGITRRSSNGRQEASTSTMFAASSSIPVRGKLSFALECFGYPGTGGADGSAPTVAMLFGPTYLIKPELNLDLGWIAPISGGQPRAIYVGVVANLGRLPLPVRRAH
ncbi:MAG: DUF4337 family protein [Gemmatimonadaceae bacterium]